MSQTVLSSLRLLPNVLRGGEVVNIKVPSGVATKLEPGDSIGVTFTILYTIPFSQIGVRLDPDLMKPREIDEWTRRAYADRGVMERLINNEFVKRNETTVLSVTSSTLLGVENLSREIPASAARWGIGGQALYAARRHAGLRQVEQRDGSLTVADGAHPDRDAFVVAARIRIRAKVVHNLALLTTLILSIIAGAIVFGVGIYVGADKEGGARVFEVIGNAIEAIIAGILKGLGIPNVGIVIVLGIAVWLLFLRKASPG